jgi:hypothetical protein
VGPFSHTEPYFRFFVVGPLNGVDKADMIPQVKADQFFLVADAALFQRVFKVLIHVSFVTKCREKRT